MVSQPMHNNETTEYRMGEVELLSLQHEFLEEMVFRGYTPESVVEVFGLSKNLLLLRKDTSYTQR